MAAPRELRSQSQDHLEGTDLTFNRPAFYSQISRQYGSYRPCFRYEYMNAANNEPIFPEVGLRTGPPVGVRYGANESVALKLQYDFTTYREQQRECSRAPGWVRLLGFRCRALG